MSGCRVGEQGGLLSTHMLLERRGPLVGPYRGELLTAAEDLAQRLLPAFDTASGIPLSWVNLLTVCDTP